MFGLIIFIVLMIVLIIVSRRFTKNMVDDYRFMLSQAEPRDFNQKMSDKVNTSMVGNSVVRNMVNVSMMHHNEQDKKE